MPPLAQPLPPGTLLGGRFQVEEPLGQGGFGITYLARDLSRGEPCIVRELAPAGAQRGADNVLEFPELSESASALLKHRFRQEARRYMRSSGRGLPLVRAVFGDLGTSFLVREYLPSALTLAERIKEEGRLQPDYVQSLLEQILSPLQRIHGQGQLHLDIKPSNILLGPRGGVMLIDPGEARRWHRALSGGAEFEHEIAPELRHANARPGPRSDVFGLGASLYAALAGFSPTDGSVEPAPIRQIRSDVPPQLAEMIDAALHPLPSKRPPPSRIFGFAAPPPAEAPEQIVARFDEKALALKNLRFDPRECPSCGEVLENPKPLKLGICPVCHEGKIRPRKIERNVCPNCRAAQLKLVENVEPLSVCPFCSESFLHRRKKGLLSKEVVYACANCDATLDWRPPNFVVLDPPAGSGIEQGEEIDALQVRTASGRADKIMCCAGCGAQYDQLPDRRWKQVVPARTGKYDALESEEWDRVAAGLPPEAGNAECDACGSDYYLEASHVALLESRFDPHHFAEHNLGRLVTLEDLRWLGVGKEHPKPGLVCQDCDTEFDAEGDRLRLVQTTNEILQPLAGELMSIENWHRAARELPLRGDEHSFDEAFALALREAYTSGAISFNSKDPRMIWRGAAQRLAEEGRDGKPGKGSQLEVLDDELRMGGLMKKWRLPMDEVVEVRAGGSVLELKTSNTTESLELEPVEVTIPLESGSRSITLFPTDLAARLRSLLAGRQKVSA